MTAPEMVTCKFCDEEYPENSDEVARLAGEPVCADEAACWDRIYQEARSAL